MATRNIATRRSFLLGGGCAAVALTGGLRRTHGAERVAGRAAELPSRTNVNLVPPGSQRPVSYWCSWQAQLDAAQAQHSPADHLTQNATRAFNEQHVFRSPGWSSYFAPVRPDLLFLADLGWDVPADAVFSETGPQPLGSLQLDARKFPNFTGSPGERLRKLVEHVKKAGWGGLGVWLPAQPFGAGASPGAQGQALAESLAAGAQLLRDAGVSYLKLDYGARAESVEFRQLVSEIVAARAPNLLVEHASPAGALNDFAGGEGDETVVHNTGRYRSWDNGAILHRAARLLEFSDVLRTYDALELFIFSSRLDRTAELLSAARGLRRSAILNNEDSLYLAASLGCAMGTLRYPHPKNPRPRIREVIRAVRWQRIAPPFPAHVGTLEIDTHVLTDSFDYDAKTADFWMPSVAGQHVKQVAPARVARGMNLPRVIADDEPPFVTVSRNPNGAAAIAALPRTAPRVGSYMPLADVIAGIDPSFPVGLFGRFRSVTLDLGAALGTRRILAQDLATDFAYDITPLVACDNTRIRLSGELLEQICTFGAPGDDPSEPGIVLALRASGSVG